MKVAFGICLIVTLLVLLFSWSGCARSSQRFMPMSDNTALDTKTGRRCNPDPAPAKDVSPEQQLPLCTTL